MFAVIIAVVAIIALIVINEISRVAISNAVSNVYSKQVEVNVVAQGRSIASVVKSMKDWTLIDTSVEALVNKLEEVTIEGNGHSVTAYRLENATAVKKYFGKISGNLMIWTITRKSDNKTVTFCSVAIGNDNFSNVEYHVRSKVFFGMGNIDNVLPGDQVVRVYNN
jgi:hypothetical protein